jgi:hypothetical protein
MSVKFLLRMNQKVGHLIESGCKTLEDVLKATSKRKAY